MLVEDITSASLHILGDRKFLILGEEHYRHQKCKKKSKSLISFLKYFEKNFWSQMDLFVELPYNQPLQSTFQRFFIQNISHKTKYKFGLPSLYSHLIKCIPKYNIIPFYKKCPFNINKVKTHIIDIRREVKISDILDNYYSYLWKIEPIVTYPSPWSTNEFIMIHPILIENIINYANFTLENKSKIIQQSFNLLKINKQLNAITDPNIKKIIKKWFFNQWKKSIKSIKSNLNAILDETISNTDKSNFIRTMGIHLMYVTTLFTDMYAISRSFRLFKDGYKTQNCIFYAGEFHANNYRNILKKLGAKTLKNIEIETNNPCIDMSPILEEISHFRSQL